MCPSPFRDHGYDISDYYGIHPQYGTMDDVREFFEAVPYLTEREGTSCENLPETHEIVPVLRARMNELPPPDRLCRG